MAYTRGNDLSGTLEGAGGIGGLLARSHGYTECSSTLNINITNLSGYCIYDLAIWDDYGTYVTGATIDNGNVGSYSFAGVAGRTYYVFGWSCDEYYIQVYSDQFTGTLENHNVHFVGEGDWNCDPGANCVTETGNPLCLPGLSGGQWLTHNYYHADGNGNITALASSAQTLTASYRYDPFGNLISQSGGLATANTYRFSSKELHANSGLYYYGYRFYSPNLQRWVNRDPIEEIGGWNLYAFVENRPVNVSDPFGLRFVYQGPHAAAYQKIIECWKEKLPEKSLLREVITELEKSPRDIRIKENTKKDVNGNTARPSTWPDKFDRGKGHDTTTFIDPKSYTYDGRTWSFPEALAHELLHAYYEQDSTKIPGKHHDDESWPQDERKVTGDAKNAPCK